MSSLKGKSCPSLRRWTTKTEAAAGAPCHRTIQKTAKLSLGTFNESPLYKQQGRLLYHLQILQVAVVANYAFHVVHEFNGINVRFATEMFGRVDVIVCIL